MATRTTTRRKNAARDRSTPLLKRLMCAAAVGASAWLSPGCMAPVGVTPYYYGGGEACVEAADMPKSLAESLEPLRHAFDAHSEVPRVVALMPHMGCERGAEILRDEILDRRPYANVRLIVVWQDVARTGDERAAARATGYLDDPRVTSFYDCDGIAGRAFARGNLPVAEAREVFLFYPAGLQWPSNGARPQAASPASRRRAAGQTPQTETWVHQLGRVVPERFCTPEELPIAIRLTVARLLEDAKERARVMEQQRQADERRGVNVGSEATPRGGPKQVALAGE